MVPASAVTQTAYCSHVKATPELSVVELIAVITTIFIKDFFLCVFEIRAVAHMASQK